MFILEKNEIGPITISNEAIETIAGLATVDSYGLVGMVSRKMSDGISSILGLETIRKGVEVKDTEDGLVLDVYIVVAYGTKISEVASNVIQKIRYNLGKTTGIKVAHVNVNVQGVKVVKE